MKVTRAKGFASSRTMVTQSSELTTGKDCAELRLVPAGTYTVVGEQITVPETYIVVTKREAFLFDSHRYAREIKLWQREIDDCQ